MHACHCAADRLQHYSNYYFKLICYGPCELDTSASHVRQSL